MRYYDTVVDLIGNTPLVKLSSVARGLRPTVLAKVEYFNPGGSVKDRIAVRMIEAAEASGELQAGRHHRRADLRQHRASGWRSWRSSAATSASSSAPTRSAPTRSTPSRRTARASRSARRPSPRRTRGPTTASATGSCARSRAPGSRPVRQRQQPAVALRDDRPGDVGADRGPGHALRDRRRHRRHDQRHRPLPQGGVRGPRRRSSAPTPRARSTPAAPAGRTSSRASARTSGPTPTTARSPTRSSPCPTATPSS